MLIGENPFARCSSLTLVVLTSGLTILGVGFFNMETGATLLLSITIPSTVIIIGRDYCYLYDDVLDLVDLSISLIISHLFTTCDNDTFDLVTSNFLVLIDWLYSNIRYTQMNLHPSNIMIPLILSFMFV